MNFASECARLIKEAKSIAALTGAGISTSAGIPDFRGPKGLYVTKRYDPDKVFDIHHFRQDPQPFYDFARDFVSLEEHIQPTRAHFFLAELEHRGHFQGVITQNIDSLHQLAGSQHVYEIHGSFWVSHCLQCGKEYHYNQLKIFLFEDKVPRCPCRGIIKPDIVFFGENVKHLQEASRLAESSDLFFVIGTSCVVYPAAMLPSLVPGKIIVINQGPVEMNFGNIVFNIAEDADKFFTQVLKYL